MQPADGTHLFFVDGEAVLFHEAAQKLFHLNTTAACVWCWLEDSLDRPAIESRLRDALALSAEQAKDYLGQAEVLLQRLGVLRGFEPAADGVGDQAAEAPAEPLAGAQRFAAERSYVLLSSVIRMRFSDDLQLGLVEPLLAHLAVEAVHEPTLTIDLLRGEDGRTLVLRDGSPMFDPHPDEELAPLVKGLVWHSAVLAHEFFLDIHAAVVGDGIQCYLFPAPPGSGKSSLFAALVAAGYEYFSDEVALLHGEEMLVAPVPLAVCVKNTGVAALSPFIPGLGDIPEHLRGDGKRVRYAPPPRQRIPPPGTRRPVGAIVFPRYRPDHPTTLERIGTMDALQALMQECLIVDTHLDAEKVANLLRWIGQTPCHRLEFSDLDESVALVRKLTHTPAAER